MADVIGTAYVEIQPRISAQFQQLTSREITQPLEQAGTTAGTKMGDAVTQGASSRIRDSRGRFIKAGSDAGEQVGKATGRRFSSSLSDTLQGIGAFFVAKKILNFFQSSITQLATVEKLGAQTASAIRSTGGAANVSAAQIKKLADRTEELTTIDNKAVQSAANLLLTFTNIKNEVGEGNDVFDQAVTTLTDMSVALGTDVSGSAIQLGKALNDPILGITALTRVGVSFDEQQKNLIRTLVESGDRLGAQKVILAELNKEFGGSAEALGGTLQGRLNKAADAFEALREKVGLAILPVVEGLTSISGIVANIPGPVIAAGAALAGFVAVGLGIAKVAQSLGNVDRKLTELISAVPRLSTAFSRLGGLAGVTAIGAIVTAAGEAVDFLGDKLAEFRGKAKPVNEIQDALLEFAEGAFDANRVLRDAGILGLSGSKNFEEVANKLDSAEGTVSKVLGRLISVLPGFGKIRPAEAFEDLDQALAALVQGGAAEQAATALNQLEIALELDPGQKARLFDDYAKAVSEAGTTAKISAAAQKNLGKETDSTGDAFDDATKEIADWRKELDKAFGVNLDLREAQSDLQETIDDLTDTLKENGLAFKEGTRLFDLNTEAGRENDAIVRDLVTSSFDLVEAKAADAAESGKQFDKNTALNRAFADLRKRFPELRDEITLYVGSLGKIPKKASTEIELSGLNTALSNLDKLKAKLGDVGSIGITINTKQTQHGGGWIYGGANVPIIAQGGEFMLRRSSAGLTSRAFGGDFLAQWNQATSIDQLRKLFGGLTLHAGGSIPAAPVTPAASAIITQEITVNEVANDPEATAFAVAARLGLAAER